MKRTVVSFWLVIFLLTGCSQSETKINKFGDPVMIKIADLQDRRFTDSLYAFFSSEKADYRQNAVLAFASIQDSSSVEKIAELLKNDPDTLVRSAAAFALGQTRSAKSYEVLKAALPEEKRVSVQREILEALGKVTKKWDIDTSALISKEGLAWSLYYGGLNNSVDRKYYDFAASLLNKDQNESTRLGAAHFFARGARDFDRQLPVLLNVATTDQSADVRMAVVSSLRKIPNDTVFLTLEKVFKNDQDYRVTISAIRAFQSFPFVRVKNLLFEALTNKNVNVGIAASEVILATIEEDAWIEIANRVTDVRHWRIQANLYEAILKVKENATVVEEIKTAFQKSSNPYQKAALLTALQQIPTSADFITKALLTADTPVVKSAAAAALVSVNRNRKFNQRLQSRFAEIYKTAIETGDAAVIGTVAEALADSTLGYRRIINDHSFLLRAKENLSLPKDNEALQPLEAAIAHFEKKKLPRVQNEFNHPIDWELVKTIRKDQKATIKTSRGNITIRLLVNEAPGSVANLIKLAQQNYFDNKLFHRVVPNFVVQAGCNRGDGWGSEDYSIRSEFSLRRYNTGSVGMASAGKDTEGTQWFITHSPTPHLNGRYTIFAEVESGMEAVHRLEVGDQIFDVELETKDHP